MKKKYLALLIPIFIISCNNKTHYPISSTPKETNKLRKLYSSGQENWPQPFLAKEFQNNFTDIGHLEKIDFPKDNPYSKEKEFLGKTLFYDPRLSSSNQIACASCHDPELAWTDNKTFSFGHNRQLGARNAMTILNAAFIKNPFWDGRANSLEHQAEMPVQDPKEMNEHIDLAIDKISKIKGYESLFINAFGNKDVNKDKVTKAIATFERTIKSGSTKFDKFIDGESEVFTDNQVLGLHLFRTKAQCINCHNTGYFSNNSFENDGTALLGSKQQDLGRYNVTKKPEDVGKFRVPTLREISRTGPWMHNGAFAQMRDIINFYNLGNPEVSSKKQTIINNTTLVTKKSIHLKKLNLTENEITALEEFLETLSSKTQRITAPKLPE